MSRLARSMLAVLTACMLIPQFAHAQTDVSPDLVATFANWHPEIYPPGPCGFTLQNVQGRNGIGLAVCTHDDQVQRDAMYASSVFSYQGDSLGLFPQGTPSPIPSKVALSLYISSDQATNDAQSVNELMSVRVEPLNSDDGNVRTSSLAFDNRSGNGMIDYLTSAGVLVPLPDVPVNYDAWNDFAFIVTNNQVAAYVNSTLVFTEILGPTYLRLNSVSITSENIPAPGPGPLRASRFGLVSDEDVNTDALTDVEYAAAWSNTPPPVEVTSTPEPGSWALMATGLVGIAGFVRRRKAKAA